MREDEETTTPLEGIITWISHSTGLTPVQRVFVSITKTSVFLSAWYKRDDGPRPHVCAHTHTHTQPAASISVATTQAACVASPAVSLLDVQRITTALLNWYCSSGPWSLLDPEVDVDVDAADTFTTAHLKCCFIFFFTVYFFGLEDYFTVTNQQILPIVLKMRERMDFFYNLHIKSDSFVNISSSGGFTVWT